MVQARQLGNELYCGVHSDEDIMANKGPTVMNLKERLAATDACRWVTHSVGHAPYVTELPYISHFGCKYVVHGDDITSDSDGNDCYRFVKEAGRFKIVKRSPGISTTDLVGRMLLCTRTHFIKSLENVLAGMEGGGTEEERKATAAAMNDRLSLYATDETAKAPGAEIWFWRASLEAKSEETALEKGEFRQFLNGPGPQPGQRIVYVDGGYDLFSSGHIEFLRNVLLEEEKFAKETDWFSEAAVAKRQQATGKDYGPAYVVVGVHDDNVINSWKGVNYPIMNIYERGLCVLQCKVGFPRLVILLPADTASTSTLSFLARHLLPQNPTSPTYHGARPAPSTTARPNSCRSHTIPTQHLKPSAFTVRSARMNLPTSTLDKLLTAS